MTEKGGMFARGANESIGSGGRIKTKTLIGVSGEPGSFSEQAGRGWIAENSIENPEIEYLVEIETVLAALNDHSINIGIFPIYNNSIGPIDAAIEAMSRFNFVRIGKIPLLVEHCLLVRPGVTKEMIDTITSQQPAIDQCERRLHRYWKHVKIDDYADTAKAAKDLSLGLLSDSTGVIGSYANARLYGLQVLERPFQDDIENMTVFIVAQPRD